MVRRARRETVERRFAVGRVLRMRRLHALRFR
jgi:hypothetical protein